MKVFTNKMMLLAVLIMAHVGVTRAQVMASYYVEPRLQINGSAAISGPKQFNWSQNPTNTTPWGRPIDSQYYNVPLVKAYDELGANPLLNGTGTYPSLAGKFALILRGGNISFSQKAKYCQDAGAIGVIIVNHKNGGTIGMAPTTPFSTGTTIPVLIISKEDGFPINDAILAGQPVTINLTSWGFKFANDLGFVDYSPATPHAFCIPVSQTKAGTPREYNFYNGSFVANFGTATQTNVKVRQQLSFTPTGGTSSVIYADSVTSPSFTQLDSIQQYLSDNVANQTFTSTGTLNMNYTLSSAAVDQNPNDNSMNYRVNITDSIFCKGRWDETRQAPLVSSSVRYSATQPLIWGPMFYVTNGGYRAVKAQLAIGADSDLFALNPVSPTVLVYLYKWKDNNTDGLINGDELSIVAVGTKTSFAATDSSNKPFFVDLKNATKPTLVPRVENNTWYFLAAELEHDFALGADNNSNFYMRNYLSTHVDSSAGDHPEYWAPNFSSNLVPPYAITEDTLSNISFFNKSITNVERVTFTSLTGLVPAMALHLSKNIPTSVESTQGSAFNKFEVFPNPADNNLTVNVEMKQSSNIVVSVVNTLGQSMMFAPRSNFSKGQITVNTVSYPAGNYYLVIGSDAGSEVRPFTVAH